MSSTQYESHPLDRSQNPEKRVREKVPPVNDQADAQTQQRQDFPFDSYSSYDATKDVVGSTVTANVKPNAFESPMSLHKRSESTPDIGRTSQSARGSPEDEFNSVAEKIVSSPGLATFGSFMDQNQRPTALPTRMESISEPTEPPPAEPQPIEVSDKRPKKRSLDMESDFVSTLEAPPASLTRRRSVQPVSTIPAYSTATTSGWPEGQPQDLPCLNPSGSKDVGAEKSDQNFKLSTMATEDRDSRPAQQREADLGNGDPDTRGQSRATPPGVDSRHRHGKWVQVKAEREQYDNRPPSVPSRQWDPAVINAEMGLERLHKQFNDAQGLQYLMSSAPNPSSMGPLQTHPLGVSGIYNYDGTYQQMAYGPQVLPRMQQFGSPALVDPYAQESAAPQLPSAASSQAPPAWAQVPVQERIDTTSPQIYNPGMPYRPREPENNVAYSHKHSRSKSSISKSKSLSRILDMSGTIYAPTSVLGLGSAENSDEEEGLFGGNYWGILPSFEYGDSVPIPIQLCEPPLSDSVPANTEALKPDPEPRYKKRSKYSREQDLLILELKSRGANWSEIAERAHCDNSLAARNRYQVLIGQQGGGTYAWNRGECEALQSLLDEGERAKWLYIAEELSKKTKKQFTMEACHYKVSQLFAEKPETFGVVRTREKIGGGVPMRRRPLRSSTRRSPGAKESP